MGDIIHTVRDIINTVRDIINRVNYELLEDIISTFWRMLRTVGLYHSLL